VITVKDENEVSAILKDSSALSNPVTFRAARTSRSGQDITDSVLLIAGSLWVDFKIMENGSEIWM
jgi:D-lactate dehydrogenase